MSIAFAIVGISYELMRLIHKVIQILEDIRHPINNASELTDYVLEDYLDARTLVREGASSLSSVRKFLDNPVLLGGVAIKALSKVREMLGRKA